MAAIFLVAFAAFAIFRPGQAGDASSAHSAPSGEGRPMARPLHNPDGTRPGLAPITSSGERKAARSLIARVRVGRKGSSIGYRRTRFGKKWADTARGVPYARNGCRTRDDLLARDGREIRYRDGSRCVVVSMTLLDPYTGTTIKWRKAEHARVQVDHVVPLSYAWRMGASRWPVGKRLRFANDPLNLVAVSGAVNEDKGGAGPAEWLPPRRDIRCAYAVRFAQVALKYHLPITKADKKAMLRQCR